MAEKPEDIKEETPEAPAADDVTLAEAEVETSDDAPADDAAALSATEAPEAEVEEAEAPKATGPKGPARQEPISIEERAEKRAAERKRKAEQRSRFRARAKERRGAKSVETEVVEADQAAERGSGRPKTRQGVVLSAKPDKTISIRIDVARRHPRYHKIMRTSSTLHVHDERNDANEGDTVRVVECRPMSRLKRWRLVEVVERAR